MKKANMRVHFFRTLLAGFLVMCPAIYGATPTAIQIVGSAQMNEGTVEPFFARVSYSDSSTSVVTATWTAPATMAQSARLFHFAAPEVTSDTTQSLAVSYSENAVTVSNTFDVTVLDVPLDSPRALEVMRHDTEPRLRSRAGFSVDAATGAHILENRVLNVRATPDINFDLTYNSRFTSLPSPLGPGWRFNYDMVLTGDPQGDLVLHKGPEFENRFRYLETVSGIAHYIPLDRANRNDRLTRDNNSGGSYTLITADGKYLNFSSAGQLVDYRNKVYQGVSLSYNGGGSGALLLSVYDSLTKRGMYLDYGNDSLLDTVTDNDDRIVRFRYDAQGRLVSVTKPYYVDTTTAYSSGAFSDPKVSVPDGDTNGAFIAITVDRTNTIGEVVLNYGAVDYTRFEDLVVSLISPEGTEVILSDHQPLPNGQSRLDLADLSVGGFQGENPHGQWKFKVVDDVAGGSSFNAAISQFSVSFSSPTDPTFYTYDASNHIIEADDAKGNRLFADAYDSQGRVIQQDDGRDTNQKGTFVYTERPDGLLETTYTDRMGHPSSFVHDGQLELLSWTDPTGNQMDFGYDTVGDLTSISDQLGRVTRFGYDASGNPTSYTDPGGNTTLLYYDGNRNLTRVRDAKGHETQLEYDANNNLTKVTDAENNAIIKTYNSRSQLLSVALQDGAKVTYGYDANGNLSYATHPVDATQKAEPKFDKIGRVIQMTDASKYVTKYEYSPSSQLIRETDPLGNQTLRSYDQRDRLISETDKRGNVTTYAYDNNDNRVSVTDAMGNVTHYAYDGEDHLISKTDPLGNVTTYAYDALGAGFQKRIRWVTRARSSMTPSAISSLRPTRWGSGSALTPTILAIFPLPFLMRLAIR